MLTLEGASRLYLDGHFKDAEFRTLYIDEANGIEVLDAMHLIEKSRKVVLLYNKYQINFKDM